MKLKKIASLALAGVMAVSMLTACGGNTINEPEQPNQPEEPAISGFAASVNDELTLPFITLCTLIPMLL